MPRQKFSGSKSKAYERTHELAAQPPKLKTKFKHAQQAVAPAADVPESSDLADLETRKQKCMEKLREVERQVYDLETKYFSKANPHGNALKGYRGLVGKQDKKIFKPEERIFSGSSTTGHDHLK